LARWVAVEGTHLISCCRSRLAAKPPRLPLFLFAMPTIIPTLGSGPKGLVKLMAEEKTLGTHGAKWPKPPSEGVATYDKMLRTLMTPAHFKALLLLRRRTRSGAGRARRGAWR
jgi:hypothetical protein